VGTGYSRPIQDKDRKDFFGVKQDIHSVGEFIRLYVTKYDRWLSPKFLAGESYGTTRAAGLAGYLQNELAMHLNGIILISSVLDFQTITFVPGNDWPFILYLPAYTNAAGYHKKLPPELLQDMEKTRHAVEKFAMGEYLLALARGDGLAEKERRHVVNQLVRYTGLGETYIRNHNLRIPRDGFVGELLRREKLTLGVLDARLTAPYKPQSFLQDPSVFAVVGPLVAAWNDYVRRELKYESDRPYKFLSQRANRAWKWGSAEEGFLNAAGTLKQAVSANPYLQVLMASGYYDLDTSYFATKYTVGHLDLEPRLRPNITLRYYEAGHQLYTRLDSLKKLKEDVRRFIGQSLRQEGK
jgi:carboxypeptidase C (cathepsin A)